MRAGSRLAAAGGAAALVLLTAAAATAGGQLGGVPATPVTTPATIALSGDVDVADRGAIELRLVAPDPAAAAFDQQNKAQDGNRHTGDAAATLPPAGADLNRTISFQLDTVACSLPVSCAGWTTAPNGRWSVQLNEDPDGGSPQQLASQDFLLDVPAQAPAGGASVLQPQRAVAVTWTRGNEPDLLHWAVADAKGRLVEVTEAQACPKGANGSAPTATTTCGVTLGYAAADTGRRDYSVTATRKCGTNHCTPVASKPSSAGSVTLSSSSLQPSAAAGAAGGKGAAAASTDPRALARGFGAPATTGLGVSRLPALPSAPAAGAAPQAADGPFSPTLGYGDKTEDVPEPGSPAGQAVSRLTSTGGGLLGDDAAMQSIAGALVLVLGGLHLRSWSSRASLAD